MIIHLAFDIEILLPNSSEKSKDAFNKDHNYKACFRLKLDHDKNYVTKRVIPKILKLDENNQYGYARIKPLPTGCIKKIQNQPGARLIFFREI